VKRREFIGLICGATAWPLASRAQQVAEPLIGFLSSRSAVDSDYLVAAFRKGLREAGYIEGQNVAIEFRWADGRYNQMPALAADLLKQKIAVFVAVGGEPSALATKNATSTIPIVFTIGGDPIKVGLVASLNRPGGNATGVSLLAIAPEARRLGMLHELVPKDLSIGCLINPNFADAENRVRELEEAARSIGRRLQFAKASNDADLEVAFTALARQRVAGLHVTADPYFDSRRERIIAFAAASNLPTISFGNSRWPAA
jgi:putative ABC transport system substrate-binding protein